MIAEESRRQFSATICVRKCTLWCLSGTSTLSCAGKHSYQSSYIATQFATLGGRRSRGAARFPTAGRATLPRSRKFPNRWEGDAPAEPQSVFRCFGSAGASPSQETHVVLHATNACSLLATNTPDTELFTFSGRGSCRADRSGNAVSPEVLDRLAVRIPRQSAEQSLQRIALLRADATRQRWFRDR